MREQSPSYHAAWIYLRGSGGGDDDGAGNNLRPSLPPKWETLRARMDSILSDRSIFHHSRFMAPFACPKKLVVVAVVWSALVYLVETT